MSRYRRISICPITQGRRGLPKPFKKFVSAINAHDVEALAALMNPGHPFVDSLANRVHGAARMKPGWRSYFVMCPDDQIQIGALVTNGESVLAPHCGDQPREATNRG
jgi:SnoaL-like protein